ncbi:MAG TPA: hypothetical protein VJ183_04825 [Chloroflexia bacterium]|nr:hypothetical protein [Chloroflexia bacterium]
MSIRPDQISEQEIPTEASDVPGIVVDHGAGTNHAADAPAQPVVQKRGWPDLLVALLLFGLLVSVPLTYLVMDFPVLVIWAGLLNALLLVCTITLMLLIVRVSGRLGVDPARARQVRGMLMPVMIGLIFATEFLLLPDSSYGFRNWGIIKSILAWLVSATLIMAIFTWRWRKKATILEQKLKEGGSGAAANLLSVLFLLRGLVVWPDTRPFKVARPAAPWQTMYETARQAARSLDKDAVLNQVSARPGDAFQHDFNFALRVMWFFDTPSGKEIMVGMRDTDPEATVKAELSTGISFQTISPAEMVNNGLKWGAVKIGPRDAFDKIASELPPYLAPNGKYSLSIDGRFPEEEAEAISSTSGGAIIWKVSYFTYGPPSWYDITYIIDSQSGEVIDRKIESETEATK